MSTPTLAGRIAQLLLPVLIVAVTGGHAYATTISVTFTGVVDFVDGYDASVVKLGDIASFTAEYDPATPLDASGAFVGALSGIVYSFGGILSEPLPPLTADMTLYLDSSGAEISGFTPTGVKVGFAFYNTSAPSDLLTDITSLPSSPVGWLANSTGNELYYYVSEGQQVRATITKVTLVPSVSVPDGGSSLLSFGMALCGLAACAQWTRRAKA